MKNYEDCIKIIEEGIQIAKETGGYDYVKFSKALHRKGNALL